MQFGEGLHGVDANCGAIVGDADEFGPRTGCPTSYPAGIAEGATFNKSLWLAVGAADGREGRALHNQKDANTPSPSGALAGNGLAAIAFWAPDINLFRDPRWGRGQEVRHDATHHEQHVDSYVGTLALRHLCIGARRRPRSHIRIR